MTHQIPTNYRGMFCVFDSANGTGKSSTLKNAANHLQTMGYDVVTTREPGGSPTAEALRALLLDPSISLDPHEQALLFMAARRNHIRTVIQPALERGAIVLCDRFVASTLVYQTLRPEGGGPMTINQVISAHQEWCWGFKPDLQFHLSVPVTVTAARRAQRAGEIDRYESDDLEYEAACSRLYADSGRLLGFRQIDIDGDRHPEAVCADVLKILKPIANDSLWCPLAYRLTEGRSGRWFPVLDEAGRPIWFADPNDAHHYAANETGKDPHLQMRFVKHSAAIEAIPTGLTSDEADAKRPF